MPWRVLGFAGASWERAVPYVTTAVARNAYAGAKTGVAGARTRISTARVVSKHDVPRRLHCALNGRHNACHYASRLA